LLALAAACSPPRKPNIVFILADDLGWAELASYGNTFNETPNLDRLAEEGVRFTDAYSAAPVCSPFRASLMSGQWPVRTGINDYLRPEDPKHLSTDYVTIAELLQQAGYTTGMIGKWHLTGYANHGAEEIPPNLHGFDDVLVTENRGIGAGSYFHPYHFNREIQRRLPEPEYLTDRLNLEAVEFIERNRDKPFFLYKSHYAVHTRLDGRPDLVAKYESRPGAGEGAQAGKDNPHLAAQLEAIDEGVGMILEKLDELGLAANTVVIFTSDNGGQAGPRAVTTNAPLREGKSTLYEGGIREPLIVRWPGSAAAGQVCSAPMSTVDFYPTFAGIAGVTTEGVQQLDGVSLLPLLRNPEGALGRDTLYWHYPLAKPHFLGGRSSAAIRKGDWKLHEDFTTGKLELYHLAEDVGESRDLAVSMPDKVKQLHDLLENWRHDVRAEVVRHIEGDN
jgi:arylsulfatase A